MNLMQCSLLLSSNFSDDPLFRYAFQGTDDQRHRAMDAYFAAALEFCLAEGNIILAPGNTGLVAWIPGTAFPPAFDQNRISSQPSYAIAGWEQLNRQQMAAFDVIRENAVKFGFCYLLAVDFSVRRRGYARMLMDACFDQMAEAGLEECWLITENEANLAILESMGFEKFTTLHQPGAPLSYICRKAISLH
ncbi:GNAT family N-acetyltransferase [Flavihumibacter stibioxidans]|uniref:N-acetyltransferase domain-containing protein n=1 Tax=Flavihumibacter stibioxidans TaxID=1834163 RepID=A0ABR7MDP6_9BACT|nr:GNAT family N-acetyltransferase [Flavihumibacter stibioxidans]MBC6492771.1 hypothetical protein [Flavihumibacter stibioxidans]